jgi:hypothetical protein
VALTYRWRVDARVRLMYFSASSLTGTRGGGCTRREKQHDSAR